MPNIDEALDRHYKLGYQRGSMDAEKQLGEVIDKLIEMQIKVKQHLNKHTETN